MPQESLEEKIASLEKSVERVQAARDVENIMNSYEYKLFAGGLFEEVVGLFAQKTPGVTVEIGNWGVYEGIEGVKKIYLGMHKNDMWDEKLNCMRPGIMFINANNNPIIEVAGDGKTAKGLWISQGITAVPKHGTWGTDDKMEARWFWQRRAADFVKEDGKWKMWHYHAYPVVDTPFDRSWVDVDENEVNINALRPTTLPDKWKADKPSTYVWLYKPSARVEYVPRAPEPYETFDETFSY
ncbi:MAG: nuclear transport factor 2 family protein [Dehalococcoidia bacterium]